MPAASLQPLIEVTQLSERAEILAACWIAAYSDGRLWREKTLLRQIGRDLSLRRGQARLIEEQVRNGRLDFDAPASQSGRQLLFELVLHVVCADGRVTAKEQELLLKLGLPEGITEIQLQKRFEETEVNVVHSADRTPSNQTAASSVSDLVQGIRAAGAAESERENSAMLIQRFLGLLVAHAVPLYGAIFSGWDVPTILIVFWLETVITGIVTFARIHRCRPANGQEKGLGIFFAMHYGLFTTVHGVFLLGFAPQLSGSNRPTLEQWLGSHLVEVALAAAGVAAEQAWSFYFGFLSKKEYLHSTKGEHFFRPYPRIIAMHLTILSGGFLASSAGLPAAVTVLIMIGVHFLIECLILSVQLPPTGLGGLLRKGIIFAAVGGLIGAVPVVFLCFFGFALLTFASIAMQMLFSSQAIPRFVNALYLPGRLALVVLSMACLGTLAGLITATLELLRRVNIGKMHHRKPLVIWITCLITSMFVAAMVPESVLKTAEGAFSKVQRSGSTGPGRLPHRSP